MAVIRGVGIGFAMLLLIASSAHAQTLDKKVLSFAAAQSIAAAAADAARARGVGVVIAVVDDGGHLILLHRLDDTQVASVNVGIGKARTAARRCRAGSDPLSGKVIGAIGVSGDTPQVDEAIAIAGADAFK